MWFFLIILSVIVFIVGFIMLIISFISKKPIKRSLITMAVSILLFIVGVFMFPSTGSEVVEDQNSSNDNQAQNNNDEKTPQNEEVTYGLGDEIVYSEDGVELFTFKVNSVKLTDERNQFSDKTPTQVVVINYSYENLADEDDVYISSMNFTVVDEDGNVSETYPAGSNVYPQAAPSGTKSSGEESYGLIFESKMIKLYFNPTIFGDEKIIFTLSIE